MRQRIFTTVLAVALGVNLYLGARHLVSSAEANGKDDVYANMEKFTRVLETVRREYVDEDKVSYEDLVQGALRGMIQTLDPHSEYMDAKKYQALQSDTMQQFGGIGVVVSIRDKWLTVVAPMADTPGSRAGLLSGDRIMKISGKSTEGMSLNDAVGIMRGKPGTEVKVGLYRPSTDKGWEVAFKREIIKTKSVRDLNGGGKYDLLENKIGYVRLSGFSEKTASELETALVKMEEAGLKALVLDLRDNPGGLLDQSAYVTEKFMPKGQVIVTTEGRQQRQLDKLVASGRFKQRTLPMVVLVNGGSASASEIVAGCLQDLGRAELVGMKTFGKGSVQSILPLRDGSALRLTTAKYYTPKHRTIHGKGITPDHVVEMTPEQMGHLGLQRSPGGLETLPEVERKKAEATEDLQLNKALELLKAKLN
ncbi:MAG TPA: S41 family peptidase [Verrucomicrobia bacterium]|nr:S41 family peptidase [Verrucomicrobiota bacterium]